MSARLMLRLPAVLAPTDDRAMVARFAAERDEASFAALVKRHGAMVLGVCRRAVRDAHHAEDAFQSVFLVLAKNPAAAANAASVGGWLFGVARRVGLSARRRLQRAARTPDLPPVPAPDPDFDELLGVLDDEVARLPDDCRAAVVACFLREQTQDDAARQLGWSLSTLRRRLDRGKELLRSRLARRGATLSALLLTNSLAKGSVPAPLFDAAVRAGVSVPAAAGAGTAWACAVGIALVLGSAALAWPAAEPPTPAPAPRVVEARPWVTVRGQVVLPAGLPVPKPREIVRGELKDADYLLRNGPVFDEALRVNPKTRGIKNVVVWLRPDSDDAKAAFPQDKIHPALGAAKPRDREVVVTCCEFEPRVVAARAGDTVVFKNHSAVAHNVRYQQFAGLTDPAREFNVLLPREGEHRAAKPLPATRFADTFKCDIHHWTQGYVWAFDHPYAAVTDADGRFEIPTAPVGAWRVVMWHERAGYRGGRDGRFGHKLAVADGGRGVSELPPLPLDTEAWGQHE